MSDEPAPERIAVIWSPEARADLRVIGRQTAIEVLHCIDLATRTGDVKTAQTAGKRLPPPLR